MNHEPADLQRLRRYDAETSEYRLAIITDEDKASRIELDDGRFAWQSTIRYDRLLRQVESDDGRAGYRMEDIPSSEGGDARLTSLVAEGGRGAEFSELVLFGERMLAFDDRTGLVCEVREGHQLVPRQILMTGCGDEAFKGFKSEWATLKGDQIVVGSHGRSRPLEWIKRLDRSYQVHSHDWHEPYRRIREALGIGPDGYVIHEAAEWHPGHERWYFFPRKISTEPFDEAVDERERGGNTLIIADESFADIRTLEVGERVPERGVSSFKLIPGHPDEFVGLKSVEWGDTTETYLFCFDADGNVLQEDTFIGAYKCEGVAIL
ncbi:MAG: hypothetical protein L0I62_06510 [Gammaproteobacteria bacterium]|nr:hypothetical protein [Gammaproteobacteria bacterium]